MPRGPVTHPRSQGQHLGVSMPARTIPCMLGCSPHWFLSWDLAPRNPFQIYIYSQRRTSPAVLSLLVSRRSPGHQLLDRGPKAGRGPAGQPERTGSSAQSRRCEVPCGQGGGVMGPQCRPHGRLPLVRLQKPLPSSTALSWAVLTGPPALGDPLGSSPGGSQRRDEGGGRRQRTADVPTPSLLAPLGAGVHSAPGVCRLQLPARSPAPLT